MFLIAWLTIILVLSVTRVSVAGSSFPIDKVFHFFTYGLTAIFFYRYLIQKTSGYRSILVSVMLSTGYGATLELLQYMLPYREFSLGDLMANASGALILCLMYARFLRKNA
jgi:VanZ family protein